MLFADAFLMLRNRRTLRRAVSELRDFDDAQLDDLGITRDQIADYVAGSRGPAARRGPRLVWTSPGPAGAMRACPPACCAGAA